MTDESAIAVPLPLDAMRTGECWACRAQEIALGSGGAARADQIRRYAVGVSHTCPTGWRWAKKLEGVVSDLPAESTRWGLWQPIGSPRVYEFVSGPWRWPVEGSVSDAVRAYWWPWSEAW